MAKRWPFTPRDHRHAQTVPLGSKRVQRREASKPPRRPIALSRGVAWDRRPPLFKGGLPPLPHPGKGEHVKASINEPVPKPLDTQVRSHDAQFVNVDSGASVARRLRRRSLEPNDSNHHNQRHGHIDSHRRRALWVCTSIEWYGSGEWRRAAPTHTDGGLRHQRGLR